VSIRLAERLAMARRRGFVGRQAELRRFSALLAEPAAPRVIFVHGPAGVGKTTLLHQFAWLAERSARRAVWVDGRETPAEPAAVLKALEAEWGDADPPTAIGQAGDVLLLFDTFESLAPLDRWLREDLIPNLPAQALVVIAGRDRPGLGWRADPGWRELLVRLPLDNLAAEESRELLRRRGVPEDQLQEALTFTRGHPLALALIADLSPQRRGSLTSAPEVMTALLQSFIDAVPTPAHRKALETAAQVLVVTESLLAELVEGAHTRELFEWLRELSIVDQGPRGLSLHDLARDVLAGEGRWRDPRGAAETRDRAAAYYRRQFDAASPSVRQGILLDFVYLYRDRSALGPFLGPMPASGLNPGRFTVAAATSADRDVLRTWVVRHEGTESARLFDHWWTRRPEDFFVVRDAQAEAAGFFTLLRLERVEPADRQVDPAVDRALDVLGGTDRLAAEETAVLVRFWMAGDTYQALSPVHTFITLHLSRSYLAEPFLAATFLPFADPGFWADGCAHLDFARTVEADFEVGGRRYGVYMHDWRAIPPLAWLSRLAEREIESRVPLPEGTGVDGPGIIDLDEEAFGAAVRDALRHLGRAEGLRGSPLLRTRLVGAATGAARGEPDRIAALREVIKSAAAELSGSPHDRRGYRALHHTYLQPAATQQHAADLLALPMSTFRRHLSTGVTRLAAVLWQRELDLRDLAPRP
jgi:energy-coupling factor transporter ATP-binding protein EcfA2